MRDYQARYRARKRKEKEAVEKDKEYGRYRPLTSVHQGVRLSHLGRGFQVWVESSNREFRERIKGIRGING